MLQYRLLLLSRWSEASPPGLGRHTRAHLYTEWHGRLTSSSSMAAEALALMVVLAVWCPSVRSGALTSKWAVIRWHRDLLLDSPMVLYKHKELIWNGWCCWKSYTGCSFSAILFVCIAYMEAKSVQSANFIMQNEVDDAFKFPLR